MVNLIIKDILNSTTAITVEQGKQLASVVLVHLINNKRVVLDFKDETVITAVFLNSFLNTLSNSYSKDSILKYLKFSNVSDKFLLLIRLVKYDLVNSNSEVIDKIISSIEL